MTRVGAGALLGTLGAIVSLGACALDESGVASDGGSTLDVVGNDVQIDGGPDVGQDAPIDVTYDVPDLGVGETEAGVPCTCVSSVPSGYTIVEYVSNQRPTCTAGIYGQQQDVVENPTAQPSTCSCTCGSTPSTQPTCSCGTNPATFNISSGNGNCTDAPGQTLMASTTCYKTSQSLNPNGNKLNNMLAAPATACTSSGGTCNAPTKTQTFPSPSVDQGRACKLTAATSTCTGGTCIPTQGGPFGLCVTNFTTAPCGGAFPVTHVVGSSVTDTRSCGPGTCSSCTLSNAGTCGTPQLLLYVGDNNCGSNGTTTTLPADNTTCTATSLGNSATFDSAKYTVSDNGAACSYSGGTFAPQGGLSVSGAFNICCHP